MKNELFEKYGLTTEDYVVTQDGAVIVKRTGIKKVKSAIGAQISIEVSGCGPDWCVVVAIGSYSVPIHKGELPMSELTIVDYQRK